MKKQTPTPVPMQKKEFWTAAILLVFLVSLHLFCTTRLASQRRSSSVVETQSAHGCSGVYVAGFRAAGDPLDTQLTHTRP